MDAITEKKWFVFIGDHHEGPFSIEDIRARVVSGLLTSESYTWKEGMPDWRHLREMEPFVSLFVVNPDSTNDNRITVGDSEDEPHESHEPHESLELPDPGVLPEQQLSNEPLPKEQSTPSGEHGSESELSAQDAPSQEFPVSELDVHASDRNLGHTLPAPNASSRGKYIKMIGLALFFVAVMIALALGKLDFMKESPAVRAAVTTASEFTQPYLISLVDRFPQLAKWISPIPHLEDLTPEGNDELKAVTQERVDSWGAKYALVISHANPMGPVFYVSTNVKEPAAIKINIKGVSDTLLNTLAAEAEVELHIEKKLGKSQVVRAPDGKMLPKGDYLITVYTQGASQKSKKILVKKTVFLGGVKDATYLSRLKDYHDKVSSKASHERSEIKQFVATLESQLESTVTKFSILRKGKVSEKQKKAWEDFDKQWAALGSQLDSIFKNWTPEVLKNEFYYGSVYQLTAVLGQYVGRVHALQSSYFGAKKSELNALDAQLKEALATSQSTLLRLKSKVDLSDQLALSQSGIPGRDGL
jgi:hypothetical protein